MLKLGFNLDRLVPYSPYPCSTTQLHDLVSNRYLKSHMGFASNGENSHPVEVLSESQPLISSGVLQSEVGVEPNSGKVGEEAYGSEFWKQPDGLGYRPCLDLTTEYKRASEGIVKDRTKYLIVVVSGGMNQQRNQIVDAVVIARILGAALVVPIFQVNVIWGDESEFSDIFDLKHFKEVLADDVRIVSALPSTHIMTRPVEEKRTPLHASPNWIRSHYHKRIKREGVLLLRGLDSRLSKDLPSDLQKLRCKVAFHALRFAPPILGIGNKLAERMRNKGPYLSLHLRMEKDVWVRTGCLPGLSPKYDEIIYNERIRRPELLTGRSNMTYHERKLAGLCPLNAVEVTSARTIMPSAFLGFCPASSYVCSEFPILPIQPTRPAAFLSLLRFICFTLPFGSPFSGFLIWVFLRLHRCAPCFLSISSFWFHKITSRQTRSLIFGIVVGCSSLFLGANGIDFVFFAVLLTDFRSILGDLCIQVIVRQIVFSLVERFDG